MTTTFAQAWESLTAEQRSSLADGCAEEASTNGLYVWRDATQTRQAIPPVLSPVILEDDHRDRLSTGAHHLLSAIRKSSEALITGQLHLFDRRLREVCGLQRRLELLQFGPLGHELL